MAGKTTRVAAPEIYAVDPWGPGNSTRHVRHQLLSDEERAQLAKIASIVRFRKGEQIYREGSDADAVFNIISGTVTAYRTFADSDHVSSFLHAGDLFGLSAEGHYASTTRAATAVVAYKMPLPAIRRILDSSASLDLHVIAKLCEELREAQRHAVVLSQKKAATRLVMFLDLQESLQRGIDGTASEIYLPMDRSSIAAYLGMTLPAVSRAFRALVSTNVLALRDRAHVKIIDRDAFNRLLEG